MQSRMESYVKVIIFLGCAVLCKGWSIYVDYQTCENTKVDLDVEEGPIYLNYDYLTLDKDVCVYEFYKTDYDYKICIDLLEFAVESSELKLEYHESVYYRTTADETYDRNNRPVDKYCYEYSSLFVAFVSPSSNGYDHIKLKIYKEEDTKDFSSMTGLIIGLPIGIVALIFLIGICVIICRRKAIANTSNSQRYVYHTANPNTVTYQAGGSGPQSTCQGGAGYPPAPIAQQGGYNVYPTQVAYPVGQGPAPGTQPQPQGFQQGHNPPTGYPARPDNLNYGQNPTVTGTSPQPGYMQQQEKDLSAPPPPYPGY